MIQQVNNMSVRDGNIHESDISYLRDYYAAHGHFPVFQQVLVETRTDCNNNCPFCPHAFNKKPLGIMIWECYTAIIDQLVSIGYNGSVALMLSNEPLLEERLEDMIKYAKCKSQRLFIDITTNCRLLTVEQLDKLFLAIDDEGEGRGLHASYRQHLAVLPVAQRVEARGVHA